MYDIFLCTYISIRFFSVLCVTIKINEKQNITQDSKVIYMQVFFRIIPVFRLFSDNKMHLFETTVLC